MRINEPPADATTLFFDMNCFFARVEQQVQPAYRGRPVGITPYTGDSGCIIAASYEAKTFGVRTGFRVKEAKLQCPQIAILPARPALYHFFHKEIIKVAESISPFLRVLSIDEFSIKLTGRDRASEEAKKMAFALKSALQNKVGDWLTCSIGIGPNQFLAKTAAEMKKPDGLFEIKLSDLDHIYQSLALTDLCGINRGIAARCHAEGIYTPYALYQKSIADLSRLLGILGKVWYFRLRGYEVDDISFATKNIGHSHVLPPEFRSPDGARQVFLKLAEKTGYRLRKDGFWATRIYLAVNFTHGYYWHLTRKTSPFQDDATLTRHVLRLLEECPFPEKPFTLYLTVCDLIKNHAEPVSLFKEEQKLSNLAKSLDKINDKFGASTICQASLLGAENTAPDRIPFGKPRFDIRNE